MKFLTVREQLVHLTPPSNQEQWAPNYMGYADCIPCFEGRMAPTRKTSIFMTHQKLYPLRLLEFMEKS